MISPDFAASLVINSQSSAIPRQTKSQKAMRVALDLGISNKTTTEAAAEIGVSQTSVAQACVVSKSAKDLVPGILDGSMSLQAAYVLTLSRRAIEEAAAKAAPTPAQLREKQWERWAAFRGAR